MNVKISYAVPFERVPEKINKLIAEAAEELESTGAAMRPNEFDENWGNKINEHLDKIDETRKKIAAIDFLLEDCYTILASYIKTLAEMKLANVQKGQQNERMANNGGFDGSSAEGGNGKT